MGPSRIAASDMSAIVGEIGSQCVRSSFVGSSGVRVSKVRNDSAAMSNLVNRFGGVKLFTVNIRKIRLKSFTVKRYDKCIACVRA